MTNDNYYDISKLEEEIKKKFGDYKLLPFLEKIIKKHEPHIKECFIDPNRITERPNSCNYISLVGVFNPFDVFVIFGEKDGNFNIFYQDQDTIIRIFPNSITGTFRSSDNGLYTLDIARSLEGDPDERFLYIDYYGPNKAFEYLMNENSGLKPIGSLFSPIQTPVPISPDKTISFNLKSDRPMYYIAETAITNGELLEGVFEDYFEMYEEKNKHSTK